jgi:hypothetical protein
MGELTIFSVHVLRAHPIAPYPPYGHILLHIFVYPNLRCLVD